VNLTNFTQAHQRLKLILELESDFADQNETHDKRRQHGRKEREWIAREAVWELRTIYEASHRFAHASEIGEARMRRGLAVRLTNAASPPNREGDAISFNVELPPHGSWHVCVDYIPIINDLELFPEHCCRFAPYLEGERQRKTRAFLDDAPVFSSEESGALAHVVINTLEQGKRDLASLRLYDLDNGERAWAPAAGAPLYMALFGRDTLTVAWEALPVTTDIIRGTLPVLAEWQGKEDNDWRDEQPGRMLHEAHTGPLSALNYIPQGRYYGSVTTSGFYPFVLAQLWHWTADKELVGSFLTPAIDALKWLDQKCDGDGDPFCAYRTRSESGVQNQGWKDSDDAIVHEDGSQVSKPAATSEEQGIVYAAKLNLAEVLWWFGRKDEAKRLVNEARELKERFNEAFWMEDEGFFAMALDPNRRQVRSIGSNALHCVATGIADKELVPRTLARLFAPDMFSGWGVRTLSSRNPAYNPYSYHRGTVWPVEHGPFAVGAYRYGCHDYVERICRSQFETAALFDFHRLPECIAGHQRDDEHPFPAVYPAANSPQAWSSTTAYTLMQAMLGMQPFAPLRMLFVDPFLPEWLPSLTISRMRVRDAVISLRFFRNKDGTSDYEILGQEGPLQVIRQPSPWSLTATLGERAGDAFASLFH
jgi:glycogen debranching enzyme